ncbi:MAG: EAL domain-containing protein [bacterium]|nr:EAL domain-containing protein [bacterium]
MNDLRYQVDYLTAMNKKLSDSEKMYRMVCDMSSCAYLYYDHKDGQIRLLGNWQTFFPLDIRHIQDVERILDYVEEEDAERLGEVLHREAPTTEKVSCECKLRGQKKWLECETVIVPDEAGNTGSKVIKFRDISRFKQQNDELTYLAYYDMLTGLYNRNYFVGQLSEWLERAKKEQNVVSVMFLDIDDFRKVNDGLGMIVGDELVQAFGQFLGEFRSDHVMASHFNSDVYCLAIYDPCGTRSVDAIYKAVRERLATPFVLTGHKEIEITVCAGVAEFPESAANAIELINNAEIVLFKAKSIGSNEIQYFDAPIIHDFLHQVQIENKLKGAVTQKQFLLFYQPQYDVESGRLRGVEALIRWKDENGKLISPAEFIPIAEKNGSIVSIGAWVVEEAFRTYAEWRDKYGVRLIMSINVSAIQYKRKDFVSNIISLMERYEIESNEIEFEITESVLIDDFAEVIEKMKQLREYGIRVSLDDFGTGFSSLSYLKGLPIDTLKIDKSFIDTVITDDSTRIITESIVSMVKKLGFETVAEGVETEAQYEYLRDIHCDNIQGFYLGKPMPKDEVEQILTAQL